MTLAYLKWYILTLVILAVAALAGTIWWYHYYDTETSVYVVGTYEAVGASDGDTEITVSVRTWKPAILVLTAYDKTRWNIAQIPFARVRRVIVGGYEPQEVVGLSPSVPVEIHTYEESVCDRKNCTVDQEYFQAFNDGSTLPTRRGTSLKMTANGLVAITDPEELAQLESEWLLSAQREQEEHRKNYVELTARVREITGLEIGHFAGAYAVEAATVKRDNIKLAMPEEPANTRESVQQELNAYNAKDLRRKHELETPIAEEDKPRRFSFGPLTSVGFGGESNSHTFTFGKYGNVYEFDAFINIAGSDLNGDTIGTSAQLSENPLPEGLFARFDVDELDEENLKLTYHLTNTGEMPIDGAQFFFFLDPEIIYGPPEAKKNDNNRIDEYGEIVEMPNELGGSDLAIEDPTSWEIDEPSYFFGNIIENLRLGMLDRTNPLTSEYTDDVSFALGFDLGFIVPGQTKSVIIMLSTNGNAIGHVKLVQRDKRLSDTLIVSGQAQK